MAKNNNLGDFLKDVADGIRAKKGTTAPINAQNFRSEIDSISTLPAGVSVNGTEITIDTDQYTAVIAGQDGDDQTGKVVISGLEIPVELDPNVDSSVQVTNLTAGNVKKDVTILGVTGTLESSGETVRSVKIILDATKSARNLFAGYTGSALPDGAIEYSDTSNVNDMSYMFYQCSNLTTIPLLDTSSAANTIDMFGHCTSLTTIPLLNTSNVTSMYEMFKNCTSLTTIPQLDTGNVEGMQSMFYQCSNLTSIPLLNTGNVVYMDNMFDSCSNLTSIPQLNTVNVVRMDSMFYKCTSLTEVPLLDTSNVTTMEAMFRNCSNLTTIPQLNTSNVTNMQNMFASCPKLTTIPLLNTSNVTNMCGTFSFLRNFTEVPLLDTSNVTDMSNMFASNINLTTIPALDVSNVTNMQNMFQNCKKLKSILMHGMKADFKISASTQFERADLVTILNNLATVTSSTTLTMGTTNLAKLTDEDKAIAINKG